LLDAYKKMAHCVYLFIILLVVTGCTSRVNTPKPLSPETTLSDDQGVLIIRVVNASSYPLPLNSISIFPDNINESKDVQVVSLRALKSINNGVTVFAAPVNSGKYTVGNVGGAHSKDGYWYSKYISGGTQLGLFNIRPNKVTDLGTLIYYPEPNGDHYKDVLFRVPEFSRQPGELMDKYYPFFKYDKTQTLSWLDDDYDEERNDYYSFAAQNPVSFETKYRAPDNNIHFLGKMGVILTFTESQNFELDAINTDLALVAMSQNQSGIKVVADAEGNIFVKRNDEQWQTISNNRDTRIHSLKFVDETTLEIVSSSLNYINIHRLSLLAENEIKLINSYNFITDWSVEHSPIEEDGSQRKKNSKIQAPIHKYITSVSLLTLNEKEYISIQYVSNEEYAAFGGGNVRAFEYDPETWSVNMFKADIGLHAIIDAGHVKLGIKSYSSLSSTKNPTYYTFDNNNGAIEKMDPKAHGCKKGVLTNSLKCRLNKKVKGKTAVMKSMTMPFRLSSPPVFTSDNEAIALAHFRVKMWNMTAQDELQIIKTRDGGKRWTVTGNTVPNKFCGTLIPDISDRLLLSCNGATGDFYESFDEGKTWNQIRQQETF